MTPTKNTPAAVERLRLEALEEIADLAASLWRSIAEAAFRGDGAVIAVHCRQVAMATKEGFAVARALTAPATPDAAE